MNVLKYKIKHIIFDFEDELSDGFGWYCTPTTFDRMADRIIELFKQEGWVKKEWKDSVDSFLAFLKDKGLELPDEVISYKDDKGETWYMGKEKEE